MVKNKPDNDGGDDRDYDSQRNGGSRNDLRQPGGPVQRIGLQIFMLGFLQIRSQKVLHKVNDHIGGHHADQEFVCIESCFQESDDKPGKPAACHGGQHGQNDHSRSGQLSAKCKRNRNGTDTADIELSLGADVVQVCFVGKGKGKPCQDQRRRFDQNVAHGKAFGKYAEDHGPERIHGLYPEERQKQIAYQHAKKNGRQCP